MKAAVLGSGSRGNAVLVEAGGHRVLIDAGFSCRQLELRMGLLGVDPSTVEALILTHEHSDHVCGAELFSRRYDVPVFGTAGTLSELPLKKPGHTLQSGKTHRISGFEVEPFAIPHDAREPVGFVLEDDAGHRLGLAGDLGSRTRLAWGRLRDLDLLILEANHDLTMLRDGPYPWALKQRVSGRHGHLSNREAAEGIPELVNDRLRWVVLYHLSQTNNLPALAAAEVGEALHISGASAQTVVTKQHEPTEWLAVSLQQERLIEHAGKGNGVPTAGDPRPPGQGHPSDPAEGGLRVGPEGPGGQEL